MSDLPGQRPPGLPNRRPVIPNIQTEETFSLPDLSGVELPDLNPEHNATLTVEQTTSKDEAGNLVTKTQIKRSVKKSLSLLQKFGLAAGALVVTSILGTVVTIWAQPVIDAISPAEEAADKSNNAVAVNLEATTYGDYKVAGWAENMVASDKPVGTIKADGYDVDIYLLAIEPAIADSEGYMLRDEVTPVITKGDPIAYFSFIFTNTSDTPINTSDSALAFSAPSISSDQWDATFVTQDYNAAFDFKLGYTDSDGYYRVAQPQYDKDVLSWKVGESFAMYKNFPIKVVDRLDFNVTVPYLLDDGSGNTDFYKDEMEGTASIDWTFGTTTENFVK